MQIMYLAYKFKYWINIQRYSQQVIDLDHALITHPTRWAAPIGDEITREIPDRGRAWADQGGQAGQPTAPAGIPRPEPLFCRSSAKTLPPPLPGQQVGPRVATSMDIAIQGQRAGPRATETVLAGIAGMIVVDAAVAFPARRLIVSFSQPHCGLHWSYCCGAVVMNSAEPGRAKRRGRDCLTCIHVRSRAVVLKIP
jgi:hypothetical protein